jgi:solute:Na+ symporter, SSS family
VDPFVYVYAGGGLIFAIGLFYAARQGWVGLTGAGLRNLLACLGVFAFFGALQGWQQYAPMTELPAQPYRGGADHVLSGGRLRGHPVDYAIVVGYFVAIIIVGTWFGRKQQSTKDFFFGGRRFSWWLIAFSLVATTVGSYSFVKYSNRGFAFGLSSSQSYLNDWIWLPLLLFAWLPIVYFRRLVSIPEYFGRRFGPTVRLAATVCILVYLVGYVGVNLFTMGKVVHALVGLPVFWAAVIVALVSASYVTSGGQTSVIMTDLLQGVMLLGTGLLILYLGIQHIGGIDAFWGHLPRSHRMAFPNFNEDAGFPTVGIFWQDALANSAMFYFLNQGIMMRFMAARSLEHSRRAALATVLVLMTIAAAVVGGGGWVARALVHAGYLPEGIDPADAFYVAAELVSRPGVFGLVLAALTAALMSTVDTLITAVAAIVVNDLYKPYVAPDAGEEQMLRVARISSLSVTVAGIALVPAFMQFDSIYSAHGAFTAAVTPPLVVTLLLSVCWRRFTRIAAISTLLGGLALVMLSIVFPALVEPFAQGVPAGADGEGLLAGMKQYKFMRACFGLVVSAVIGVVVTLFTKPESEARQQGLVWGTVPEALAQWRARAQRPSPLPATVRPATVGPDGDAELDVLDDEGLPSIQVTSSVAEALGLAVGDRVYLTDRRWWLGGLYSAHALVGAIEADGEGAAIELGPGLLDSLVAKGRASELVLIVPE